MKTDASKTTMVSRSAEPTGAPKTVAVPAAAEEDTLVAMLQRDLLEDGPPTCIVDAAGTITYANKAFHKISDALAAAEALPSQSSLGTRPHGPNTSPVAVSQEHKLTIEGRTEYFRAKRRAIRGADGSLRATAMVYEPTTKLKATATALVQATTRLDDTTRLVSDWVWETDQDLILTFVSPRVHDALGYHPRELIGRSLNDIPSEATPKLLSLISSRQHVPFRDIEVEVPNKEGEKLLFRLNGLPVYCPDSGDFLGYRGTAENVTALRQREEALIGAKESAELANRAKTEFLANMSHELRTPLNAVIGFSEIMESELLGPLGSNQYKSYASDIHESAQHLLTLINDILDVAKIEAGAHELREEVVDPRDVVNAVQRLVAERAKRADQALEVALPENLPRLRADERKLKQVLLNLMSNAIKFTPEKGVIELSARLEDDGSFVFQVSDTGIGISREDIPRAFAAFEQVDSRLNRQFEGTGLGLPLSAGFVKLHGGRLDLESEPGVGTRAIVRLPANRVL
ncbi:PAS domain-containing sensor histidine kinase [Pelagibius litoralis]|uniref:histidine kinase n=1 Tax=Pelagibius litoralis TaxID=374515 RepID=A0A967C1X3_9PROT|nr:PAS domain-containing sensor histidine kinase [Pelagibius litoralis]NIA68206.1 PAS domain-containing sensor histidine kinase [Pelagibius litoralis]